MRVYMKEKKQAPPQKELAGSLSTLKKRGKTQEKIRVHATPTPPPPGDTDEDDEDDDDEGDDDENEEEDEDEQEEKEDNFSAKSLSLAKSAKPLSDPEEASKTIDRLARFTLLNRLDLSHAGLKSTEMLAEAVNTSQKESAKRPAGTREWFGRRLTWLSMAGNAGLGEELAASNTKEPVKGKAKAKQAPSVWSGLELMQELFVLNLSHCALPSPPPIASLPNLRALILSHNNLSFLAQSSTFPLLPHLNTLVLSHNSLKSLPTTLPSSCPSLTKLSITFNDLGPSPESKNSRTLTILPDFTPLLSLREVRLGQNPRLAEINLPAHIATWGTGSDGSGKGLTVLELNSCGIDDWKKLGPLLKVDKAQNQEGDRRGGLAVLNLKDNPVCELDGYRKKILAVHRNLRSLDDVRIESNVPKKDPPKSRNASRPAPSTDANAEPVSERTKRKREDVDEEAVATPSDSDPAATKKRSDSTKKEEKAGKTAPLKKEGTHEESASKKRKHLKEDTKSSEQESQTPSEANAADTSKKGARRGGRGGAKKSNKQEPSPEKMDVDAVEAAAGSTSVGDASKQPAASEDSNVEPGAPKKKRRKAKKETAAASDVPGDDQTPSTSANPIVKKEPKEKKLRQRQAKKLQPAVAWDAEPAGIKEEVGAGTSQAAEQSAGPKPEDAVKQKTSVVGVIEVKKRNKTKREEGAAPASAASGSGSAIAPEVAASSAISGGAGADEIGTGKSEDAWGGGGDGFW
ncbi:hypothetical protein A4X09_0g1685 [Tilletia walkeri]|uniref:L domain-like protein n=1 Tax=Tilletia walkeri TaxID=117179 RepID=A0A8X7NBC4_9BASI|nr:hypothetical protein A4X09_0g1685 [Tilletia walkeri]